ncbi:MAG: hypothetical protein BIFFINMI_04388 [Phycisphaerae bacterium]|nr:hypothetical protein [Phycisphaerae bacterium]
MRATVGTVCVLTALLMSSPTLANVIIQDDFQADSGLWEGWTGYAGTYDRTDLGGGNVVFAAAPNDISVTKASAPALPAAIQIDVDIQTNHGSSYGGSKFQAIHFHVEDFETTGNLGSVHYGVAYVKDWSGRVGLQLLEESPRFTATVLATNYTIPIDTAVHHLRITDDGAGVFNVYWDDMVNPAISYDDSASYSRGGDRIAVQLGSQATGGYIDNLVVADFVTVPEPATMALLVLGGLLGFGGMTRRSYFASRRMPSRAAP